MQKRRLVVTLPGPAYKTLEERARDDVRTTEQQASYLLRRLLTGQIDQSTERQSAEARP